MKNTFLLFCFLSATISGYSQIDGTPITIGTYYNFDSKTLNDSIGLQVYLPESYASTKEDYPVLYLLDGQRFFANGVAIQKSLRTPIALPEMIVVGIDSYRDSRRAQFRDGDKYTEFLKDEVIAFIDSNFRSNSERIIFGWEAAAYYISKMIVTQKELFSAAIISDGGFASENDIIDFQSDTEICLYIANSRKDIYYISSTDNFSELLTKYQPKNLRWKYELFNEEVHQSLPHLALYKGIKYYYHNYDSLVFENIQQYIDLGELAYLKDYFKERAKRFGGDGTIDDNTKNGLIWLAWNRDNFEYFSFFMEEFSDVLATKRYASAYWQNRLGQFCLKHGDYKNAIKHLTTGLTSFPNSNLDSEMQQGLNEAKKMLNSHIPN